MSKIEWTDKTWNPVTGCTPISEGCEHCYAARMAKRLQGMGLEKYQDGFEVTFHEKELDKPFRWKKPRKIFVASMGDMFHRGMEPGEIMMVFNAMHKAPWHIYQLLTKRPKAMAQFVERFLRERWSFPSERLWTGVSVENARYGHRIGPLLSLPTVRFVSFEPLLGPVEHLVYHWLDWVIVGGETGPGARPMEKAWVRDVRDKCIEWNIPFFFKGWGGSNKNRELDGREWSQFQGDEK